MLMVCSLFPNIQDLAIPWLGHADFEIVTLSYVSTVLIEGGVLFGLMLLKSDRMSWKKSVGSSFLASALCNTTLLVLFLFAIINRSLWARSNLSSYILGLEAPYNFLLAIMAFEALVLFVCFRALKINISKGFSLTASIIVNVISYLVGQIINLKFYGQPSIPPYISLHATFLAIIGVTLVLAILISYRTRVNGKFIRRLKVLP